MIDTSLGSFAELLGSAIDLGAFCIDATGPTRPRLSNRRILHDGWTNDSTGRMAEQSPELEKHFLVDRDSCGQMHRNDSGHAGPGEVIHEDPGATVDRRWSVGL